MKIISALLIFCALLFTNCKKDSAPVVDPNLITKTPFENSDFKIERVNNTLPNSVSKIHFYDETSGICLTSMGEIYGTTDRGVTWQLKLDLINQSNCVSTIGFEVVDDQTIVAYKGIKGCTLTDKTSRTNVIFRTQNRGKTWTSDTILNTQLSNMALGTDKILYFVTQNYGVQDYKNYFHSSKDAGLTWTKKELIAPFAPLTSVFYLLPTKIRVLGNVENSHNPYMQTADGGLTWEYVHLGTGSDRILRTSLGESVGYYLTYHNGTLLYNVFQTVDGGKTWSNIRSFKKNDYKEIKYVTPTTAMLLGVGTNDSAGFSYTLDAGKTWTDMSLKDNVDTWELGASSFYDAKNGYIVGSRSVLFKITFKK
jgi:photosystem II stability/assembly factor-like uncharacterized protein